MDRPGSSAATPASVFKTSLPVCFGYIPLGMAFGVLLVQLGVPWWWATVMAIFVYAGSGQFLAVSLLATGTGLVESFIATFLLNLRHVFYGLTVLDRYKALGRPGLYAIFGMTDETFSLVAATTPKPSDKAFIPRLTAMDHLWWICGCTLGALVGRSLPFGTKGLDFSLTALFAVLLVEQLRKGIRWAPLIAAVAAAALCLAFLPGKFFLIASIGLSSLALVLLPSEKKGGAA